MIFSGTEEYFSKYEFTKPYQLASSDCESLTISELIELGGGSGEEFLKLNLGYPEMPGSAYLRKEISSLYRNHNQDQILVLGSPIEGIYLVMRTLCKKGDHIIVLSPAYDALFNIAESISGNATRRFLQNNGSKWRLDFDQLEKIISSSTKLLILNFPHNPTGFTPTEDELQKIVKIAEQHNVRIFCDEIYRGLLIAPGLSESSLADLSSNAITMSGASKGLGLPGLRLGWLTIKDPALYNEVMNYKTYTSMCSSQTLEYLGPMAVRAAPKLINKNLRIIRENMILAETFFAKWQSHLTWIKPLGSSVSVFKVNAASAELFCNQLADRHGIVLLPIKYMGYEDQYVRMGFGRKNFQTCLEVLDHSLETVFI